MQKMLITPTTSPTCPAWEHVGHSLEGEGGQFCVELEVIFIYDFVLFGISHILFEHKFIL